VVDRIIFFLAPLSVLVLLSAFLLRPLYQQRQIEGPEQSASESPNLRQDDKESPSQNELQTKNGPQGEDLKLRDFRPRSMLKAKSTKLRRASFPVIDVHSHFGFRLKGDEKKLDEFVSSMNRNNIAMCVSLDAILGDEFGDHCDFLWKRYPNRFAVFARVNWMGDGEADNPGTWDCHRANFGRRVAMQIRDAKKRGCSGLKFLKQFGLGYKNPDGSLIKIDDERWDPIWTACGETGLPVLIHTSDPAAFFEPTDETNERWEELSRHPDWSFHGEDFPTRKELLDARNRVIHRHPKTKFICAHVANNAEDLATVATWMETYPNMYVELASRIGELGRQPYSSREFLIKYRHRVLFGTDGPWPELRLSYYWRFLETFDEYFPYSEKEFPPQGFWRIYGVGLPRQVQAQIYYQNTLNLMPELKEKYAAAKKELRAKNGTKTADIGVEIENNHE